jgi:hypothetical protein
MKAAAALGKSIGPVAILVLATGCLTSEGSGPSEAVATLQLGAAAEKAVGGPTLDQVERHRLADAAQHAFAAATGAATSITSEPNDIDAEPTLLSAKPVGPRVSRPDGSMCRPIELSITKNGETNTGTLTFCQVPGSTGLKPSTS